MVKVIFFLLLLSVVCVSAEAQRIRLPSEYAINLYDSINQSHYEFSGLARWRNTVLLISQHRSAQDSYEVVAIDTASIDSVLQGKALFAQKTTKLVFSLNLGAVYDAIKKASLPRTDFGGIEAAVVVGDEIFFAIETDTLCYVIKGTIDAASRQINFAPSDTLSLPKPDYTFGNAGFESLAYLPNRHRLIAIYENNAVTAAPTAFTFTTMLTGKQAAMFTKPLLFRLTDISYAGGNALLGINHYYRDYAQQIACGVMAPGANTLKNEYCYYVAAHLPQATKEMHADPRQTSFTRIVELTVNKNNEISWKEKKIISYSSDNREGTLPYKTGVLMVVDGRPPGVPCQLSFFDLK